MITPPGPPGQPPSGPAARGGAIAIERVASFLRTAARGAASMLRGRRVIEILTVLTVVGGGLLVLAEFLPLYRVERGVVVVQEPTAGNHHAYSLLVAGVAVIGATLMARASEAWAPAAAAGAIGLAALGLILFGDLPDATSSGLTADVRLADADPAAGFWVELAGAAVSTVFGALLALRLRR